MVDNLIVQIGSDNTAPHGYPDILSLKLRDVGVYFPAFKIRLQRHIAGSLFCS